MIMQALVQLLAALALFALGAWGIHILKGECEEENRFGFSIVSTVSLVMMATGIVAMMLIAFGMTK